MSVVWILLYPFYKHYNTTLSFDGRNECKTILHMGSFSQQNQLSSFLIHRPIFPIFSFTPFQSLPLSFGFRSRGDSRPGERQHPTSESAKWLEFTRNWQKCRRRGSHLRLVNEQTERNGIRWTMVKRIDYREGSPGGNWRWSEDEIQMLKLE